MNNTEELLAEIEQLRKENIKLNKAIKHTKFGLVWMDVPEAFDEESENKIPVLEEITEHELVSSTESEPNILIEGDNYHSLTCLNYTHKGTIDIIYIDPPYNTGDGDFHYKDKRVLDKYPDGQLIKKDDPIRHSKWLSFIDKRLSLADKLLKKDGLLVVSIDDNEIAQLKLLLDKKFDGNTKIVAVKMSEASGLKMGATKKSGTIPKLKEYLVFAKKGGVRGLHFDPLPKEEWDNEYNLFVENFTREDKNLIDTIGSNNEITNEEIAMLDEIAQRMQLTSLNEKLKEFNVPSKTKERDSWLFENSYRIVRTTASSSVHRLAIEKKQYNKNILFFVRSVRGLLYLVKSNFNETSKKPRVQVIFAEDNLTQHPGDFWSDIKTTGLDNEGNVSFKNGKKPLELIKRILNTTQNKNAIILDFFAGSGTTGQAVLELNKKDGGNRQFILCTNNENNICQEITYQRLLKLKRPEDFTIKSQAVDFGLKYYKTKFTGNNPNMIDDDDKIEIAYNVGELVALRENTLFLTDKTEYGQFFKNKNGSRHLAIYFQEDYADIEEFKDRIISNAQDAKEVLIYVFSWGNENHSELFEDLQIKHQVKPIPQPILEIYKKIYRG